MRIAVLLLAFVCGLAHALVGAWRSSGNLVMVTHGSTILALTRIPVNMGEIMVLTSQGEGRFALAGRFTVP